MLIYCHQNDIYKNIAFLKALTNVLSLPSVTLHSLHKGYCAGRCSINATMKLSSRTEKKKRRWVILKRKTIKQSKQINNKNTIHESELNHSSVNAPFTQPSIKSLYFFMYTA